MAVKKSELYSTLWKCCDELRGGMDASQYKDYVFVFYLILKRKITRFFISQQKLKYCKNTICRPFPRRP